MVNFALRVHAQIVRCNIIYPPCLDLRTHILPSMSLAPSKYMVAFLTAVHHTPVVRPRQHTSSEMIFDL